jgi:tetratricopeptide (TPR) repeat protein
VLEASPQAGTMLLYFLGALYYQQGDTTGALETFRRAAAAPSDYVFPHRLDSIQTLQTAMRVNPPDARAPFYLGNFWYAHRRYLEAIACWERARELDPSFATAHRNLGLAYYNKIGDAQRALAEYERAFELNQDDGRVLFELDQLERKLNQPPPARLARLQQHPRLVQRRDDLTIEYVALLNSQGRHAEAYDILMRRQFHPWEGGEGKTTGQYVHSLVAQARSLTAAGDYTGAVACLERAAVYPPNLGEGKLPNAHDNNLNYFLGLAYAGLGDTGQAQTCFEKAAKGASDPASARYYNDQPPDMIFYQGLARKSQGRAAEAREIFQKLVNYGQAHLDDAVAMDYFAV